MDSYGKKAGKGALIAEEVSNTIGTAQDQYLFQPMIVENHPNDSRVKIDESGTCQSLTSRMGTGGGNTPLVLQPVINVEMEVAVRKHEVDQTKLVELLRKHKGKMTNSEIAEALDVPETMVAHWFRRDKYFAIPDAEIWLPLKNLLGITTDEFDKPIMEYEFKGGSYDMSNRIYAGDVAPTLTTECSEQLHLLPTSYCIGNGQVHDAMCPSKEVSKTLNCMDDPMKVVIAIDRAAFNQGVNAKYDFSIETNGAVQTIVAKGPGAVCHQKDEVNMAEEYIVRRLMPIECGRLQGFPDGWGEIDFKDDFTDEEYAFWLDVRNSWAEINGKQTKDYTKDQMLKWYNKLHTDAAEYKMWGNGLALPNALYVMEGIVEDMQRAEI